MGSLGSALANAVVESFFATIRRERPDERFTTRAHAHRAIAEWIEVFYNIRRRHSFLGYVSPPVEFESRELSRSKKSGVR